jgi:hypothetical protein
MISGDILVLRLYSDGSGAGGQQVRISGAQRSGAEISWAGQRESFYRQKLTEVIESHTLELGVLFQYRWN